MEPRAVVVGILVNLFLPLALEAGDRPIVAVFDIETKRVRVSPDLLDLLTEQVSAGLTESGLYRVVPRDQLRQRLVQQKSKSYRKCYDQSCQIEMGRELAAEKSLATKIGKVGKLCTVTATLYNLKTATAEKAANVRGQCGEVALLDSIVEAVRKLTREASDAGRKGSREPDKVTSKAAGERSSEECGTPEACHRQAREYAKDRKNKQNLTKAFDLYQRGCAAEYWDSCAALAPFYENGTVVKKDFKKAVALCERACLNGIGYGPEVSCIKARIWYEKGIGVKKSPEKAKVLTDRLNKIAKIRAAREREEDGD